MCSYYIHQGCIAMKSVVLMWCKILIAITTKLKGTKFGELAVR